MEDILTDFEKQMLTSLNSAIKAIPKQTPQTKAGISYWFSLYQMFRNSFTGYPIFQGVKTFDNLTNETLLELDFNRLLSFYLLINTGWELLQPELPMMTEQELKTPGDVFTYIFYGAASKWGVNQQIKVKESTHLETVYRGVSEYKKCKDKEPSKKLKTLIKRIEKQTGTNYYELPEYEAFQYLCVELLKISKISNPRKKDSIKTKIDRYLEDSEEFFTYINKNIRSQF